MNSGKEKLADIAEEIKSCTKCHLHETRKHAVPGEGDPDAKFMLIGLGPGHHEDQEGRPFVGRAGNNLEEYLTLINLNREKVFITNVIKCYLPDNEATKKEIETCTPYLDRQLDIIQPTVILPLGKVATSYILRKFGFQPKSMGKLHGKVFKVNSLTIQAKIVPLYHPAATLYNPALEETVKKDWKQLRSILEKN